MATNSDGDVVIDILLDGEKAQKYWENFSDYMTQSTKQLEKQLTASAKRINDLGQAYGLVTQELRNARKQKLDLNFDENKAKALARTTETIARYNEKIREMERNAPKPTGQGNLEEYKAQLKAHYDTLRSLRSQRDEASQTKRVLTEQAREYANLTNYVEELKDARKEAYERLQQEKREFEGLNQKYITAKQNSQNVEKTTSKTKDNTKKIASHTRQIKANTGNMATNFKKGLSTIAKGLKKIVALSLALIGIRSIYGGITSALNTWLNSEDELAKQTKANLENLKANFSKMLQPAIQWILNMFNNILAVIGAVVRQFAKINIFAKNTAKSTGQTAKNTSNTLASFDKIDVLQQDSGGGNEDSAVDPIDMESLMNKYENIASKIKAILETIFDPFKKAWDNKGEEVMRAIRESFNKIKELVERIGESFVKIWTNGSVQKAVETILDIFEKIIKGIGNIADAWRKAWDNNGYGDKLVQNFADIVNDILGLFDTLAGVWEKITESEGYQKFANAVVHLGEALSGSVKVIADTIKEAIKEKGDEWAERLSGTLEKLGTAIENVSKAMDKMNDSNWFKKLIKDDVKTWVEWIGLLVDLTDVLSSLLVVITDPRWENFGNFGKSIGGFIDKIADFGDKAPTWTALLPLVGDTVKIAKILGLIRKVVKFIEKLIGYVKLGYKVFKEVAKYVFGVFWNWFKTTKLYEALDNMWKRIKEWFKEKATAIYNWLWREGGLLDTLKKLKKAIEIIMKELKKLITEKFEELKRELPGKVEEIKKNIIEKFDKIKENMPKSIEEAKARVIEKFEQMKTRVGEKVEEIKKTIREKFDTFKTIAGEKFEAMKTTIHNKLVDIRDTIVERIDNIKKRISEKWDEVKQKFVEKWEEIKKKVGEKAEKVVDAIKKPFEGIGDAIKSILGIAWGKIKDTINWLLQKIEDMINYAIKGLNTMIDKVRGILNNEYLQKALNKMGISGKFEIGRIDDVHLTKLAKGGIVTQTTPAIIGEAGREAVLPLDQNTDWMDALAEKIAQNQSFSVNFNGSLSQLAKVLKPEIDKENRRVGKSYLMGGA